MKVSFRPLALSDLDSIYHYIAQDNPGAADRLVSMLRHTCQRLSSMPLMGRPRDELGNGIRSIPFGSYVIFYRIVNDQPEIVRVLHGARDLEELL